MGYTIKNFADVQDSAPQFGLGELQEARFANDDLGADSTGVSLHRVKPGKRQGFAHRHDQAEEIYVILSGSGRIKLDDEILEVRPMDAIRMTADLLRVLEAGPDGLEYLAFGPRREGDGEMVHEGFWD